MKSRALSSLAAATALIGLAAGAEVGAASIDLAVLSPTIGIGDSFAVEVRATGAAVLGDEVLGFGFDITNTDGTVVSLQTWTVEPLFSDVSASLPATDVAGTAFPGVRADEFLLATLWFKALAAGKSSLGIRSDIADPNEGLVYLVQGNVDITTAADVTVVPLPAAFGLFALGATGLLLAGGVRRGASA